jgi:hypothetical protein
METVTGETPQFALDALFHILLTPSQGSVNLPQQRGLADEGAFRSTDHFPPLLSIGRIVV